jgi:hypothetical protein
MKKQINPTIKAHLTRSAFYVILLLAVCVIPFALAQRNTTKRSVAKPKPTANLAAAGPRAAVPSTGAASAVDAQAAKARRAAAAASRAAAAAKNPRAPASLAGLSRINRAPVGVGVCTDYTFTLETATLARSLHFLSLSPCMTRPSPVLP